MGNIDCHRGIVVFGRIFEWLPRASRSAANGAVVERCFYARVECDTA
jgi:hypothetical protein